MVPYELKFAPLPCWQHLPTATVRKKVAQIVAEIEEEAAAEREKRGTDPLGMENIRGQDPFRRPVKSKRSPKPLCHAASKELRKRMRLAYRGFVAMFQEASLKVKFGRVSEAIFPKGSFPPTLPFRRTGEVFDPLADAGGSPRFAVLAAASVA